MTGDVWELYVSKAMADWQPAGTFATLADAAVRIAALERSPRGALLLEAFVDPEMTDAQALSQFHHTGLFDAYVVRRVA